MIARLMHAPIAAVRKWKVADTVEIDFRVWCQAVADRERRFPRTLLDGGLVHVWIIPLAGAVSHLVCGQHALDAGDSGAGERDRQTAARRALLAILATYIGSPPSAIELAADLTGRPYLARPRAGLDFNLSHSGRWAALAVAARRWRVGIDIEQIRQLPDLDRLLQALCSPGERSRLDRLPAAERLKSFFAIWTEREALAKASGSAMRLDAAPRLPCDGMIVPFEPAAGYSGTVAVLPAADLRARPR
jgi:hypothetical protein